MLTNKWIVRAAIGLVATVAMIAAVTSVAMAAGPEARVIVVHVTDGSDTASRASLFDDVFWSAVDLKITVDQDGVGGSFHDPETGRGGGGGPDGIHPDQRDNGDTAAGLRNANRNCGKHSFCHVILVNYRQPESRTHRVAAKVAADELKAAGHRLHAVAVGDQVDSRHLGFNWYLSGQAFSTSSDEAVGMVSQMAHYAKVIDYIDAGGSAANNSFADREWSALSYIEKIWLNPLDCDLETQWLWASDATCHDKR